MAKLFIKMLMFFLPWGILQSFIVYVLRLKKGYIIYYSDPERSKIIDLIDNARKEVDMLVSDIEAFTIVMCVKRTEKIEGDIAEVGVFRGGTAKLICETKKFKALHLFDTFCGIPEISEIDQPAFYKGRFTASLEDIKPHFDNYENVYFHKGQFPYSSDTVKNKKFSFVHLDVDTYGSTLNCLEFFYTRVSRGGIILSHDYMRHQGVKSAFDKFFNDKPEIIIEIADTQCLIVKL